MKSASSTTSTSAPSAELARRLGRYEFLFTAAPLRIEQGMGSPMNPIATF